jgi:hypothetical protein
VLPEPSTPFELCGLLARHAGLKHVVELILGTVFLVLFCVINGSVFKKAIFAALFAPFCLVLVSLIANVCCECAASAPADPATQCGGFPQVWGPYTS